MKFTLNNKDNFFKDFDKAYIEPPKKLPLFIRLGAWISKKIIKKENAFLQHFLYFGF